MCAPDVLNAPLDFDTFPRHGMLTAAHKHSRIILLASLHATGAADCAARLHLLTRTHMSLSFSFYTFLTVENAAVHQAGSFKDPAIAALCHNPH